MTTQSIFVSEEARGGTGQCIPLELLKKVPNYLKESQKFFVAGGVSSENVSGIIEACLPDGIDVLSSLEGEKGGKDSLKVKEFFVGI